MTLVVLGILAGSLRRQRGIETRIGKALQTMSQDIHGLVTNQMFDEQEQAYQFLCDWIDKYGAKKAVLFQYVGSLSFISSQEGWGIGKSLSTNQDTPSHQTLATGLIHTTDGGKTWKKVNYQIQ